MRTIKNKLYFCPKFKNMEQKKYEFKYEGTGFLDLNTLVSSQFHFIAIINEIQKQVQPDARINIKVSAFKEGSFIINMIFESNLINNLFNNIVGIAPALLPDILKYFQELIDLYNFLKGKKPETAIENDNGIVVVTNGDNNNITINRNVFKIYRENIIVNNAVQQNFELLDNDESIDGITIIDSDEKNEVVKIPKDKFTNLKQVNEYFTKTTINQNYDKETLHIKKPNLFPDKNKSVVWGMIYRGRDINAKISDKAFLQRINEGLKIGQGDRIVADFFAVLKYDERVATFVETGKYEVTHIYEIHDRPKAFKLDDFINPKK